MPDRWGQNMIRLVDRPSRVTPLDLLYYAGDRRFGALGISSDADTHLPHAAGPAVTAESLTEANEIIQRVLEKQPLGEREQIFSDPARVWAERTQRCSSPSTGKSGSRSSRKATSSTCRSSNMPRTYSRNIVESVFRKREPIGSRSVTSSCRSASIDMAARECMPCRREPCCWAKAAKSYSALASIARKFCEVSSSKAVQRELFARMAFNILIDNTDDHTKNHAFLRLPSGRTISRQPSTSFLKSTDSDSRRSRSSPAAQPMI